MTAWFASPADFVVHEIQPLDYLFEQVTMRSTGPMTPSGLRHFFRLAITLDDTDAEADGLPDRWEQQIVDADPLDAIDSVSGVLPGSDFRVRELRQIATR